MFKLFVVIIALVLDRGIGFAPKLRCYHWFDKYCTMWQGWLQNTVLWRGVSGTAIIVLSLVAITWCIGWLICGWLFGLLSLLFSIGILLYCLGPMNFNDQFGPADESKQDELAEGASQAAHQLSEDLFFQANQRIFAVLFWFIILGPVGAVLYRATVILKRTAMAEQSDFHSFFQSSNTLQAILDWLPARLVGLVYALVGDFIRGFQAWMQYALGGLDSSETLLKACGVGSIAAPDMAQADGAHGMSAMELINRSIWTWLIIYIIIVVCVWLF